MSTLNDIFGDRVFVINCAHRQDRMAHFDAMAQKFGIRYQRFEAHTGVKIGEQVNNNAGCTASHRALLEVTSFHGWPRAFIFEDDAEILHEDFNDRLARYWKEVPDDWDMVYLGAGYAENPIARVTSHIIRAGRLLTTSSYAVTAKSARALAPNICGIGPIDSLYFGFHREFKTYITQPRLVVQYSNFSDLQGREMDNSQSMLDTAHETTV